jgi:hypothetical protein
MSEPQHRRRRRVRTDPAAPPTPDPPTPGPPTAGPPAEAPTSPAAASVATSPVDDEPAPWVAAEGEPSISERGLRGLVGGGSSQITPAAALRARDAARPRADDLARAEAELTIVRRNWAPRD